MENQITHIVEGHEYKDGACNACGQTSADASEFDFIRAWYTSLEQRPISTQEFTERINRGELPNLMSTPASIENTEVFLKTLVNGAVVVGRDIVDVVHEDGAYCVVRRLPDRGDTINPK